jgi:hypothetical protein
VQHNVQITAYLNKLKIVEKYQKVYEKNLNKMSMAKDRFRDSRAPSWPSGPRTDVPAEPLIGPVSTNKLATIRYRSDNFIGMKSVLPILKRN